MRGFFIFNKLNDVVFHKSDSELKSRLVDRGVKAGYISLEDSINISLAGYRNVLVSLFSPLVTSQRIMSNQFDNRYKSIEDENHGYIVLEEKLSYTFIYVDNLKDNSQFGCERQLNTFKEFTRLLCGPAIHILGRNSYEEALPVEHPSRILGAIFDTWNDLYRNEVSHLVEGVERLIINRDLSCTCLKLMENVLSKMRNAVTPFQELFSHAFILVKGKLLYLYSSRNAMDLSKGDLLMIIALVKVLHSDVEDENILESSPPHEVQSESENTPASTINMPHLRRSSSFMARFMTTLRDENVPDHGIELTEDEVIEEAYKNQKHLGIFLKNKANATLNPVPHFLHSIVINDQMKVVILSDVPQWASLSASFAQCSETLYGLVNNPLEGLRCSHTKNILDQIFQRIDASRKKLKLNPDHERLIKLLVHKWDNLKKSGLNEYLQNGSKLILNPRLEILMSALFEQLQDAFEQLIYRAINTGIPYVEAAPSAAKNLKSIGEGIEQRLSDSMEYLMVKAADNISMTSYLKDFPGLIHYIYVDRNTGFIIAPSLTGEYKQLRPEYLATAKKELVWQMVEFCYSHLMKERQAVMFQDESFYYSYFLWFEDSSGKPLKPKIFPSLKKFPMPGIIGNDFYRKLSSECFPDMKNNDKVQVYELFCIHVGVTTPPTILDQSRRLAATIWEFSGAAHTNLDLL